MPVGRRKTRQRGAIEKTFAAADRPLSPAEVLERAQERVPTLGLATVYRALRSLEAEGKIEHVQILGQPDRYERADLGHHHHFCCRTCDQVFDLVGCPLGESEPLASLAPKGFQVEQHEVLLFGQCASCGQGAEPEAHGTD